MDPRQHLDATPQHPGRYDPHKGVLAFWDLSGKPTTNRDLKEKLGKADKTRAGAIIEVDKDNGFNRWADGILNERKQPSVFPIDPDGWTPRIFGPKSRRYGSWMIRLSADSTNPRNKSACRSTMVLDQERDQQWAWLSDQFRVTEPNGGAGVSDKEIQYDSAGFLAELYDKLTTFGKKSRGVLATTVHRNLGFVTDGVMVGQWSQIVCFPFAGFGGTPTGGGGRGATVAASSGGGGAGRASTPAELMLRGDVKLRFHEGPGRFLMEKGDPAEVATDEPRLVHLFLDKPGNPDDGLDTSTDANDNIRKLPKDQVPKVIRGWVKVPRGGGGYGERCDMSYHSPPPPPPPGSSSGSDVATGGSATPTGSGSNPDGSEHPDDVFNEPGDSGSADGVESEDPTTETGQPTNGGDHGYVGATELGEPFWPHPGSTAE